MSDNNNLNNYIDNFFNILELNADTEAYKIIGGDIHHYHLKDLLKASIDEFLEIKTDFTAFRVYEMFLMIYQFTFEDDNERPYEANIPLNFANLMLKYNKHNIKKDIFIDSVDKFVLGLAIYSQNRNYRAVFEDYVKSGKYDGYYRIDGEFSHEEFLYRWGITALFQDIALPLESMGKPFQITFNRDFNNILNSSGETINFDFMKVENINTITKKDIDFINDYRKDYPYSKFFNLFKPTDLMVHNMIYINKFNMDSRQASMLRHNLDYMCSDEYFKTQGFIDHGILSAIIILNIYGYLIQKYGKNPDIFFYPIADSATAILLHNYYIKILQQDLSGLNKLKPNQSPLAYLLILCDKIHWPSQPLGFGGNEFWIRVDDNGLDVEYIGKVSSLDSDYVKGIKNLLNQVIDIESIFRHNINVLAEYHRDVMFKREMDESKREPHSTLPLGTVEDIAVAMYDGDFGHTSWSFKESSAEMKLEYFNRAKSIPDQLSLIGYELADLSDEREAVFEFHKDEAVDLARHNHDEWCRLKITMGWTYGTDKDNDARITPFLIPWGSLPPEIQKSYLDSIIKLPSIMESVGLKIVATKLKALAMELLSFQSYVRGADYEFNVSGDSIRESESKVEAIVEVLNDEGYSIVDVDSQGRAIDELDDLLIDNIARRVHENWCRQKIAAGWRYGKNLDFESRTDSKLVGWYDLDGRTKALERHSLENLSKICGNVGLKIVEKS